MIIKLFASLLQGFREFLGGFLTLNGQDDLSDKEVGQAALNEFAFNTIDWLFSILIVCLVVPPLIKLGIRKYEDHDFIKEFYGVSIVVFIDRLATRLVNVGPGLLTTIGIFFTFLGITIGLKDFDTSSAKMNESIEDLLNGMKLAFFSSVLAIGSSVVIKILSSFVKSLKKEEAEQIKEAMSGENLSKWQRNYEKQIKNLVKAHEKIRESLQKSDDAVEGIATQTEKIPAFLKEMGEVIVELEKQKNIFQEEMTSLTESFAVMRDKAVTAMPFIENKLKNLTDSMQKVVNEQNSLIEKISDTYKEFPNTMDKSLNDFRENMRSNIEESVDTAVKTLGKSVTAISLEFARQLEKVKKYTEAMAELERSLRGNEQKRTTGE